MGKPEEASLNYIYLYVSNLSTIETSSTYNRSPSLPPQDLQIFFFFFF